MVEFGVHVDEVVCQERRRRRVEGLDDSRVDDTAQTHRGRGDCIPEK